MERLKGMLPFLLVLLVLFYLPPLILLSMNMALLGFLGILLAVCFLCSLVYGILHPFGSFVFAVLAGLLFLPSAYLFYSQAWVYAAIYALACLAGGVTGTQVTKLRKKP
jgi:hypothetical protein